MNIRTETLLIQRQNFLLQWLQRTNNQSIRADIVNEFEHIERLLKGAHDNVG
jgi:hypothetical protein